MKLIVASASIVLVLASPGVAQRATLQITNPSTLARPSQVVDIPLSEVNVHLRATDAARYVAHRSGSSDPLLTQVFASRMDSPADRLLVLVDLAPKETIDVELSVGEPGDPPPVTKVQARAVPERKDDFAWENDVVAFRTYGPALEATGEISSGIDVWSKRVPTFVTTSWYRRDEESQRTHNPKLSYHKDNGEGLDSYDVGASRGCGGTAIFLDGKLFPSKNYTAARILADGPIRADFVLDYAPWQAGTATVREQKRITLDAGSKLNHIRSTFTISGADTVEVAAGVAVHEGGTVSHPEDGIVSVWDTPQLTSAGRIGTALLVTQGAPKTSSIPVAGKQAGDALFVFPVRNGGTVDYYAGTAWSQADTPTQADFNTYLAQKQMALRQPPTIRWK